MTELLSPAGDLSKLETAWAFGADAAYMGLEGFSLRTRTGSLSPDNLASYRNIRQRWPGKKLYLAVNRYFHQADLSRLTGSFELVHQLAPDGIIVADLGAYARLRQEFPRLAFHVSTQANTVNSAAVTLYRDIGFSRVILGRECTMDDLAGIRQAVPDMELEVFVHGAMCMAVSGRCFLSAWMTGRSANAGDCAHSCRWRYRLADGQSGPAAAARQVLLEEEQRPGEYLPLIEESGYSTILSSKDLCLIDHIQALADLGIDSLKIEGRMKSEYYVAMVTRAYRQVLDGQRRPDQVRADLDSFSHREYSAGFLGACQDISSPALGTYQSQDSFLAVTVRQLDPDPAWVACQTMPAGWHRLELDVRNLFSADDPVDLVCPDHDERLQPGFRLVGISGETIQQAKPGQYVELYSPQPLPPGSLLRIRRTAVADIESPRQE